VELRDFERSAALLREQSIRLGGCAGSFDFAHLQEIHRRIFQDIYAWAGKPRTVDTQRTHLFCRAQFIENSASRIFAELAAEGFLKGLDRGRFVERLAYFMSEVNVLHPFRDGNGRTQRMFFELLAADAGFQLDWSRVDERQNVEACVAAMEGRLELMVEMADAVTASTHESPSP
jgi:cell filamentation protein